MSEHRPGTAVAVVAADAATQFKARRIAAEFGLTWLQSDDARLLMDFPYHLQVSASHPTLVAADNSHGPVSINFNEGRSAHRRRFGGGRNQPLARAIGVGRKGIDHVVDATAGFGGDAFVLASLGCAVTLIERSAALAVMLTHAVDQARLDAGTAEIAQRMSVVHTDASIWLLDNNGNNEPPADTIYLDPMYPDSGKRALARKNMQALQAIAGPDTDSEFLLHAALAAARRRVVVKRPKGAHSLTGRAPDTSISSAKTRYDIYLVNP